MSNLADSNLSARKAPSSQARRAYELIRSMIRSGRLSNKELLVEDELVKAIDLSRASVRQALAKLAAEGLIQRQRHMGTRVSHDFYQMPIDDILPWRTPPGFMYRKINDLHIASTSIVRERLETDASVVGLVEQIFEQVTADGAEPIGIRTAYYRTQYTQPQSWPTCPSMAFAFQYVFGVALGEVQTVVDAVACDDETAALLHVVPGAPLLVREQTLRDVDGVVQEFSFSHYRADRVSFPLRDADNADQWSERHLPEPTPDVLAYRVRSIAS